jgi:hypothetical protein
MILEFITLSGFHPAVSVDSATRRQCKSRLKACLLLYLTF